MANKEEIIITDSGPLNVRINIKPGSIVRKDTWQQLRPGEKEGESIVAIAKALELFDGGVDVSSWGVARRGSVGVTRLITVGGIAQEPTPIDVAISFDGKAFFNAFESPELTWSKSRVDVRGGGLRMRGSLQRGTILQASVAGVVTASIGNQ